MGTPVFHLLGIEVFAKRDECLLRPVVSQPVETHPQFIMGIPLKVATDSGVKPATHSRGKLPPVGAKRRGMLHCYSEEAVVVVSSNMK